VAGRFDDILSNCTERLLQGESVEQCLARYPEQAAELEPLLMVAAAARRTSSAVEPRPEFKARVRHEVQSQLRSEGRKPEAKRTPALHWMPRWAMAAVTLVFVVLLAGTTTVAASSETVPGDTLYSVKTASEQVQLKLTFSKAAKARLEARFAGRRVWETARLAQKGRLGQASSLAARFEAHLANIEQLAARIEATDAEDGKQIAKLEDVLKSNMAKDLALLDEAEARAPWRYRGAVAVAKFRLMQEYDKAIDTLDELQNQQQSQDGSAEDAQSAGTGGSGPGGETGDGGSAGSGQQGQVSGTGSQVEAGSPDAPILGSQCARLS